jgi:transcription elongation factor GreA
MNATAIDYDTATLVTREGYEHLRAEIAKLCDARPEMIERLRDARDNGNLDDNPTLYEVLEEQAQLEQRIAQLRRQLAAAKVVQPKGNGIAGIGNSVRLRDLATNEVVEYELVGGIEANVGDGRVSIAAPVGRAVLGARAGEMVDVTTPRGNVQLEVLEVRAISARKAA